MAVDTESIAVDRLRKMVLSSRVRVTPDVAQVYDIDLTLDSTKIAGGMAFALRTRPSFSVDVSLDRLNIDAYFPGIARDDTEPEENKGSSQIRDVRWYGRGTARCARYVRYQRQTRGRLTHL